MRKNIPNALKKLSSHYDKLFEKYGRSFKTAQLSSRRSQEYRMRLMFENIQLNKKSSVLDFGCGTAQLYKFLKKKKFEGKYLGIDISRKIVEFNKKEFIKNKNVKFLNINLISSNSKLKTKFDYTVVSGTFNNNTGNNWIWMKKALKILFKLTKKTLIFNNLSTHVDYKEKNLFYVRPEKIFHFCKKNLSEFIIIRNDYSLKKNFLPYEFTTFVFKKKRMKKNDYKK